MVKPLKNLFTLLLMALGLLPPDKVVFKVELPDNIQIIVMHRYLPPYRGDTASFFSSSCVTSTLRQMLGGTKVGTSQICHMLFDKVKNAIESLEVH